MMHHWKNLLRTGMALSASLVLACGPEGMEGQEEEAVEGAGEIAGLNAITPRNASDPSVRIFGDTLYVYTSSDMNISGTDYGNSYPMKTTFVYSLQKGKDPSVLTNWVSWTALQESQLSSWVTSGSYHLWAPDAIRQSPASGKYYLYAPDVEGKNNLKSRISVSSSTVPTDSFTVEGRVTFDGKPGGPTDYASDPHVLMYTWTGGTARYLVYADGDDTNCGGFRIGKLSSDMKTVTGVRELVVEGYPQEWVRNGHPCDKDTTAGVSGHPYMEGASLYYLTSKDGVNSGTSPFYLIFPVKPSGVEGTTDRFGLPSDRNQVIAYARASSVWGPYKWQGIVMESQGDWTNQASIAKWGSDWLFFYHTTQANADGLGRDRGVRAECFRFGRNGEMLAATTSLPIKPTDAGLACATGYPR